MPAKSVIRRASKPQPSRKGKKAWRKNVDITDVEEALEEARLEERMGGNLGEKPNNDLFVRDTSGNEEARSKAKHLKPLRVDEILSSRSKVQAIPSRLHRTQTVLSKEKLKSLRQSGKLISKHSKKQLDALIQRRSNCLDLTKTEIRGGESTEAVKRSGEYDVWTESGHGENEIIGAGDEADYLRPAKRQKVRPPVTLKIKPRAIEAIPAVKIVDPGASYNPTMESHQTLLKKAHEDELEKIKKKEEIRKMLSYPEHMNQLRETEGSDEEDDEQGEDEHRDRKDDNKKKREETRKKTKAERNKEKRFITKKKEEEENKRQKELKKELARLGELKKNIEEAEMKQEQEQERRRNKKEDEEKAGLKKLSRYSIQKPSLEIQLQDELTETLRQLKPEGNLLRDRFVSLQERNIIESRVPVSKRRRYKLKEVEKFSHKNFK